MNRKDQLYVQWKDFNFKHPEVSVLFDKFTFDRISLGFKNYSADAVMHRVRWETNVGANPDDEEGDGFKINNNHVAFYARDFMDRYQEHEGFFRTREQISERGRAR